MFDFEGPPYLGRAVRVFMAVGLGPVVGLVGAKLVQLVHRRLTGADSPAALCLGGVTGWLGLALLVLTPTPKPTPGTVTLDDEKIVRTWRGIRTACELRGEKLLVLRDRAGQVLVVADAGLALRAVLAELAARVRRKSGGSEVAARLNLP